MSEDRSGDTVEKSWLEKIGQLFSSNPNDRGELRELLAVAVENDVIDEDARSIMEGAMKVSDMQARDIMIPRAQMVVIDAESPLEEILPQIIQAGHSRFPVVGESHDDVLGILLAKDLLPRILNNHTSEFRIEELLRPTVVVPESKRLNVLLREFREKRSHMAIVIDEYGGVAGLVTIEDVLEEIVGEIEDETDVEMDAFIRRISDDDFFIKALTPIDEFNDYFKTSFSNEEFDTIGGLVIQALGHVPIRNETAVIGGFEFKVINADQRKIHSMRMRPAES
jgi:magnesium and cobalt transporter